LCCFPDAWPAGAARHGKGRPVRSGGVQLKVPGSTTTGAEPGIIIVPPPSPQHGAGAAPDGPQAGPHAGSCIGSPQAGWQDGDGPPQGAAPAPPRQPPPLRPQGERNSMNDGRRQLLLALPKQLEHPGAAARPATTIASRPGTPSPPHRGAADGRGKTPGGFVPPAARHVVRLMIVALHHRRTAATRRNARASSATTPPNPSSRSAARPADRWRKSRRCPDGRRRR